jgi:quercetin dioxygenase-like cupin family protein
MGPGVSSALIRLGQWSGLLPGKGGPRVASDTRRPRYRRSAAWTRLRTRHDVGDDPGVEAFFAASEEGERLELGDRSFRLLGELSDLEVVEAVFEPGWEGVDPHVHDDHTDSFYVLEGEVEFLVNGEWRRGGAGSFFSAPPGVEHGFRIVGEYPLRVLNVHAPNVGFVAGMRPQ